MPTTPSVLPASCVPLNCPRFQPPVRTCASAAGIFLANAYISASACSAVESVLAAAVFITSTPRAVAASRSMLSTPTPARAIALSLPPSALPASMTGLVIFTPLRTAIAS